MPSCPVYTLVRRISRYWARKSEDKRADSAIPATRAWLAPIYSGTFVPTCSSVPANSAKAARSSRSLGGLFNTRST